MKKIIALYGKPVNQSMSPTMHNFAFELLDLNYHYIALDIDANNLAEAINSIRALNFVGANITIPYKEEVSLYLDEVDKRARAIGAVNTILNKNGHLIGYNTDGQGYINSLENEMNIKLKDQNILIIGAGGAARGIIYSLFEKGITDLHLMNRTYDNAKFLADDFKSYGQINITDKANQDNIIKNADIIINTSPLGMYSYSQESPINTELIHSKQIISDIIYNPLKTKLLIAAEKKSAKIHNGLGMLVNQGALAFEIWTGQRAPITQMYELIEKIMIDKNKSDKI